MKYIAENKEKIIQVGESANSRFWDTHWNYDRIEAKVKEGLKNRLLIKYTQKYLLPPAKVIDAGCGLGQNVYALDVLGYDSYGIDFAAETVGKVKEKFPKLKLSIQDVRRLDYPDNFFDGYWSLGVIEHFWDGYDNIITEANRTIKKDGFLFLTIPSMSPLRKLKTKFNLYKKMDQKSEPVGFYCFILDKTVTVNSIEKMGFKLIEQRSYGAIKGIKDEVRFLNSIFQKIYDSQNLILKMIRYGINLLFDGLAGHMTLFVFKKL